MISDINSLENKENRYQYSDKSIDVEGHESMDNRNWGDPVDDIDPAIDDIEDIEEIDDDEDDGSKTNIEDNGDKLEEESEIEEIDYSTAVMNIMKQSKTKTPSAASLLANQFDEMSDLLMKPVADYPVEDKGHNVWCIKDWSSLSSDRIRGPTFKVGDYEWNILLFPRGNGNGNSVSIYIEPHPLKTGAEGADRETGAGTETGADNETEPTDSKTEKDKPWYVCAQFAFDVWNPNNPKAHLSNSSFHRFSNKETDWGFTSFVDFNSLHKTKVHGEAPLLGNDSLNITAYVKVIDDSQTGVLWYNFVDYDSKKSSGYVGLNNQGATCYLNSLLQSYFTTKVFRKLVYQIPTSPNTIVKSNKKIKRQSSVALSLQKIFYLLSTSKVPVGTLELTKSFGWDSSDAFTQHDIQELNRILMDKLETSMKNTPIENKLNDLFVGKMKSFIKCINVPYESARTEDFWDIQLNVKGFKHLNESFQNYIEHEMLTGDNKYQAGDEYGYQDAKKGVVFESFPPVLHLQLKRFEYDFMIDDLQKINDRYEFPDQIDLSPYLDEDLPTEIKSQNWTYKLHGVLVHQGTISNGHYYAMIKPTATHDNWLRFEDDKVWKVTKTEAFEHNFGADEVSQEEFFKLNKLEQSEKLIRRQTSAYMLVYYREDKLDEILPEDDEDVNKSIPSFIPTEIEQQLNEIKTIENLKLQQLYNINVNLVTLSNFQAYKEFDYYYDPTNLKFYDKSLVNKDPALQPLVLSLKKTDSILVLYNNINTHLKVDKDVKTIEDLDSLPYRLLVIIHRNNQTNRIDDCTDFNDLLKETPKESLTLSAVYNKLFNRKYDEMVFYIEEFKNDLSVLAQQIPQKTVPYDQFQWDNVYSKFTDSIKPIKKSLDANSGNILIFLKLFNSKTNELRGISHVIVSKDLTIDEYIPQWKKVLGLEDNEELDIIEEITSTRLEVISSDLTFEKNELNNGDVLICLVKQANSMTDLSHYFRFLTTRLHIHVSPIKFGSVEVDSGESGMEEDDDDIIEVNGSDTEQKENNENILDLWVSTTSSCEQLSKEIAAKIGQDPDYLRLFIIHQHGNKYPVKTVSNLSQYFPKTLPISTIVNFEYEILDIPLKDYENMKVFKVYWLTKILQYEEFEILISLGETVTGLVHKLLELLPERNIDTSKINKAGLFMYCGNHNKYVDVVRFDKKIESLNDSFDYYIGDFPVYSSVMAKYDFIKPFEGSTNEPILHDDVDKYEYEMSMKHLANINILTAFHFHKNSNYHHSIPFIFFVFPDEHIKETKKRLQHKLGLNNLNFGKVKIALADHNDKGKYIDDKDDSVLYDQITESLSILALDHVDKNPKRSIFDKGISIK